MPPSPPINILLVDDRPENLLALEGVLSELGQNLVRAHSGEEALKYLLQDSYALILLDVQMPDMDGFETAARIRAREKSRHTPIIFLTAVYTTDAYSFQGYALGAVDYITKPFEPEILKAKARVFIDLFQKTQAVQQLNETLERRVQERTVELQTANEVLKKEIAERQRGEREREELLLREQMARRAAEAANRLKDEFLATVSHELRTPLTAMLGWARILRHGGLDDATTGRAIETIERNAKAQAQLIEDLLDVSRIITGKLRLDVRPVELPPVIEAAVETVRPAAEAKGVQIQMAMDPRAGPVSGDPGRLQQVVWNLLSNAIKFTPKGGRVQVRIERADAHIEITVSDTGVGIHPEFLPHVFERFRQGDSTSTRSFGGLGLGLAIVRHLVELHGGTVGVDSRGESQGATFTVKLPLMILSTHALPPERAHPHAEGDSVMDDYPSLAQVRVLVVDDEADTREMLTAVLVHCDAEVKAAASAAEALQMIEQWPPDVLVSDIEMPGEDGYAFIRKVRALGPGRGGRIPAAALTAYARAEDRRRALAAGYQIHVAKPVDPAELAAVVASLAGRTRGT